MVEMSFDRFQTTSHNTLFAGIIPDLCGPVTGVRLHGLLERDGVVLHAPFNMRMQFQIQRLSAFNRGLSDFGMQALLDVLIFSSEPHTELPVLSASKNNGPVPVLKNRDFVFRKKLLLGHRTPDRKICPCALCTAVVHGLSRFLSKC